MNLITSLRRPYLSIFLASLVLFVSCSQYYNDISKSNSIDSGVLKSMHQSIKSNILDSNKNNGFKQYKTHEVAEAERIYLENIEYLNDHNLEQLFEKNNVDPEIISELEFYENNQNNEYIYQDLIDNFNFDEDEANILFTIIEVKKLVEQQLENTSKLSKSHAQRISWGCALAIAGTVGATIGFIGVTGGAGLVYALAMKGLATAALIEACGDGWGDI